MRHDQVVVTLVASGALYILIAMLVAIGAYGACFERYTRDARRVLAAGVAALWPAILAGVIACYVPHQIFRFASAVGRGFRDIYRAHRPAKAEIPAAKVVRR